MRLCVRAAGKNEKSLSCHVISSCRPLIKCCIHYCHHFIPRRQTIWEPFMLHMNFLAVPTQRWRSWRVSRETTQLQTVTAFFLWIMLADWRLGANLPPRHAWLLVRTTTQDWASLKSLRSLLFKVDPLFKWVIWGVKSHLPLESNCFNLIFLWYD